LEELHKELSEKKSELRCVHDELSRRDKEHVSDGSVQSLRSMVLALHHDKWIYYTRLIHLKRV
jgi:hypothetical protein